MVAHLKAKHSWKTQAVKYFTWGSGFNYTIVIWLLHRGSDYQLVQAKSLVLKAPSSLLQKHHSDAGKSSSGDYRLLYFSALSFLLLERSEVAVNIKIYVTRKSHANKISRKPHKPVHLGG